MKAFELSVEGRQGGALPACSGIARRGNGWADVVHGPPGGESAFAFQQRQANLERGALADLAFAGDPAAVAVYHRLHHGQAQAEAGAAFGGGEALVLAEQARQFLGGDAPALVG